VRITAGDGPPPVGETDGRGQGERAIGFHLLVTKPATAVLILAGCEVMRLDHDGLGTGHLLLGLASEGDGAAASVLQQLGAGLLELRFSQPPPGQGRQRR
jgi:hypothetical protein